MFVGINGFGRIGKAIFLQLLTDKNLNIKAINAPGMKVSDVEKYLRTDSTHSYDHNRMLENFVVLDESSFSIDGQAVFMLNERDASKLDWQSFDITYVIDATGVYLTTPKAQQHKVDYVIMCAPPKDVDVTPQFIVNGNQEKYQGEAIVSNASCTTNCIVPVLKSLLEKYVVKTSSFTTIHAATASQNVIDTNRFEERTSRSVLGNIIPHKTGASKSVHIVLPEMKGKISGTSLRVPVQNVSIVDLNISLERKAGDARTEKITLKELFNTFDSFSSDYLVAAKASGSTSSSDNVPIIHVEKRGLVSCDFNTTCCPSIVDGTASMALDEPGSFKIMIWYDNEWSYAHKTAKLLEYMVNYNDTKQKLNPYFIENQNLTRKCVVLRLDWNVPVKATGEIDSFFRIDASMRTIQYILAQRPKRVIIVSHLGRPKEGQFNAKYSFGTYLAQIQSFFEEYESGGGRARSMSQSESLIAASAASGASTALKEFRLRFLPKGVCQETLTTLASDLETTTADSAPLLYLLENVRFHAEETTTTANSATFKALYESLGDFFVNDAFATCHREHVSVMGAAPRAYGYLIEKETRALSVVTPSLHKRSNGKGNAKSRLPGSHMHNLSGDRVLAIIGGGKMDDKLPLLEALSKNVSGIYIAGGNINSILNKPELREYIDKIAQNPERANVYLMVDGLASTDLDSFPTYQSADDSRDVTKNFYDIGMQSIVELDSLIKQYDLIFWNGTLGVVENKLYSYGSTTLVKLLMSSGKKVIVGGGDTSAFVEQFPHNFYYVSTGGGASLEYLSNEEGLVGLRVFSEEAVSVTAAAVSGAEEKKAEEA